MTTTAEPVHDPVHKARHAVTPDGQNLTVDTWLEPGGELPPSDGEVPVPPGTKHGLKNVSGQTVHARCRVIPAGDLEAFLTESAAAAQQGLFMRGGIPRGLRGARWGARFLKRHREETVMTFPPRFVQSALIALLARSDD